MKNVNWDEAEKELAELNAVVSNLFQGKGYQVQVLVYRYEYCHVLITDTHSSYSKSGIMLSEVHNVQEAKRVLNIRHMEEFVDNLFSNGENENG